MKFSKFLEDYIQEDAITEVGDLCMFFDPKLGIVGFFRNDDEFKTGLDNMNTEALGNSIISGATYERNETENCFEVKSIYSTDKYGPMLYVAMMQLSEGKGLCPSTRQGNVSKEARQVWGSFFEPEKNKISRPLAKPLEKLTTDYHGFEQLNYKYINLVNLDLNDAIRNTIDAIGKDPYEEKHGLLAEAIDSLISNKLDS